MQLTNIKTRNNLRQVYMALEFIEQSREWWSSFVIYIYVYISHHVFEFSSFLCFLCTFVIFTYRLLVLLTSNFCLRKHFRCVFTLACLQLSLHIFVHSVFIFCSLYWPLFLFEYIFIVYPLYIVYLYWLLWVLQFTFLWCFPRLFLILTTPVVYFTFSSFIND